MSILYLFLEYILGKIFQVFLNFEDLTVLVFAFKIREQVALKVSFMSTSVLLAHWQLTG